MNLFEQQNDTTEPEASEAKIRPLADLLRPDAIDEVIGQDKLLATDGPLGSMLAAGKVSSVILRGSPGVGKTTIGRMLAEKTDLHFGQISAIFSGVVDRKKAFQAARDRLRLGQGTPLLIDVMLRLR